MIVFLLLAYVYCMSDILQFEKNMIGIRLLQLLRPRLFVFFVWF